MKAVSVGPHSQPARGRRIRAQDEYVAIRSRPHLQPRVELERLGQRGGPGVPDAVLAQVQRGEVRVAWGVGE